MRVETAFEETAVRGEAVRVLEGGGRGVGRCGLGSRRRGSGRWLLQELWDVSEMDVKVGDGR